MIKIKEQILDATCGGKSIWNPKNRDNDETLFIDKRQEEKGFPGKGGESYGVEPDEIQDFRDLPYDDEEFKLVIFDPPHVVKDNGMESITGVVQKKYGALHAETWQHDLKKGFEELFRVLEEGGTLVFKFADSDIDFQDVLELSPYKDLAGTRTKKTSCENRWFVFQKHPSFSKQNGQTEDKA